MAEVGDRVRLTVGSVAHGGHFVARLDGQVIFVRHALPGEVVIAEISGVGPKGRYLRADAREVESPSAHRVEPPCHFAGTCGGCDFQHIDLGFQRELKAQVIAEQLQRLAGIERDVVVEPLGSDETGLGWRTRMTFAVDADGRAGLRRHRSHDVVPIDTCLISHPLIQDSGVTATSYAAGTERIDVTATVANSEVVVSVDGAKSGPIQERAAGRSWQVSGGGFWQVHVKAADTLVETVLGQLQPAPGEHVVDLYAGVGLFAGPLGERVGVGGRVDVVEASATAISDAAVNLADLTWAHFHGQPVEFFLRRTPLRRCDLIVLDPPRTGARRQVMEKITKFRPRAISYVACDPAALARDLAIAAENGYRLADLRAFDLFPNTHHVECVALLVPGG
jgi:tRNA/tmRNA/rRNA uracil-C5-methylase (TrmA/RlmC/RlmD family)